MNHQPRTVVQPSRPSNDSAGTVPADCPPASDAGLEHHVLEAIRGTSFGTIEVTIHQSRIVQITRSEKIRF